MKTNITDILKEKLTEKGASLVGFADLRQLEYPTLIGLQYGVSIAIAMTPSIVRGISAGVTLEYYAEYNQLNNKLQELADIGCRILEEHGYQALGQAATTHTESGTYRTALPHKTVATRAGLGWIGKNALLVTQKFGSALRLSSILTNAPLETGIPIDESACGRCTCCTEACIAQAIKGINWDVSQDRDTIFDATSCRTIASERAAKLGIDGTLCGKCIEVCPYTQRYIKKQSSAGQERL